MQVPFDSSLSLSPSPSTQFLDPESGASVKLPPDLNAQLQTEKIKILLKQCDSLRKQMVQLQKENKDNVRVKKIKKIEKEMEERAVCF